MYIKRFVEILRQIKNDELITSFSNTSHRLVWWVGWIHFLFSSLRKLHLTSFVSLFGHYGLEIEFIWWFKNWKTIFSYLWITRIMIRRIVGDSMILIPCNTQNTLLHLALFQISFCYTCCQENRHKNKSQAKQILKLQLYTIESTIV